MPRMMHHDRVVKLFLRAVGSGGIRLSMSAVRWPCHGDCTDPFTTEYMGRPRQYVGGDLAKPIREHVHTGKAMTMRVEISTRCRRCANCAKARSNLWRWRVREELRLAGRSWFGTLTMSPIEHYRVMAEARHHAATRGVPWASLTDEQRFQRIALTSLKAVTKYIKRVRKQSKVPLRYIVVTERHKSGLPHFHMLVHEVELKPVTHRILSTQWALGFEKWKLVPFEDPNAARYICKYLTKDAKTRIRASQAYGKPAGIVGPLLALNQMMTP